MSDGFYHKAGLLKVGKESRKSQGLIDTLGRDVFPLQLDEFFRGSALSGFDMIFRHANKSKLLTIDGVELFAEYEGAYHLFDHFFAVKKAGNWGIMTTQKKQIVPFKYEKFYQYGGRKFKTKDKLSGQSLEFNLQGKLVDK